MDAIYFGNLCWMQPCYGDGPWVQADMENGLFQSNLSYSQNSSYTGMTMPFVTAMLKNDGQTKFALRAGDARAGVLTTEYAGSEPSIASGYSPMHQEGAVVLGTGGDNSNLAIGSFFEGVMTAGYPSDTAENAVQGNIVSVGYDTSGTSARHLYGWFRNINPAHIGWPHRLLPAPPGKRAERRSWCLRNSLLQARLPT